MKPAESCPAFLARRGINGRTLAENLPVTLALKSVRRLPMSKAIEHEKPSTILALREHRPSNRAEIPDASAS